MKIRTREDAARAPASALPKRRGRPLVDDKRRRILDAAIRVFSERGYHGTAMPDVAAAARVSTGTLYYYFEHKEKLVNEAYRDAKLRMRSTLYDQLPAPQIESPGGAEAWFLEVWSRMGTFERNEPEAYRFLEMQDHTGYLDPESRQLEVSVIAPLFLVGKRVHDLGGGERVDITMALMCSAFLGLVQAQRLGYLRLDETTLRTAGRIVWRLLAPEAERVVAKGTDKRGPRSRTSRRGS